MTPKCRGALLTELMHEMKELKEELDDRKYGMIVNLFLSMVIFIKYVKNKIINVVNVLTFQ